MSKTRRVYYKGYLLTQFYIKKRWVTMPQGAKGPKIQQVAAPEPDPELLAMNKRLMQLALAEADRGPTELEQSIQELTQLGLEEQKRTLTEGPRIPETFRNAIRGSFDVARKDAATNIQDQFTQFINQARRDLIGRGLGGEDSTALSDVAGFAASEQGKVLGDVMSRLGAAQASAEVSGATDLAELTLNALNLSSGRLSEEANRKLGLLGGGMGNAASFFDNNANRRLQAAMFNAQMKAGGGGGGFNFASGVGGAASGALTGAAMGSMVPGIGTMVGGAAGGLAGLLGGFGG